MKASTFPKGALSCKVYPYIVDTLYLEIMYFSDKQNVLVEYGMRNNLE
jgi:hypothetical protein